MKRTGKFNLHYFVNIATNKDKYMDEHVDYICQNQFERIINDYNLVSDEFVIKYFDRIKFDKIFLNRQMDESFLEKYFAKINKYAICMYQNLSDNFIEKYKDKLNWGTLLSFNKFDESILEKYFDYIDSDVISYSQDLSEGFIEKYFDRLSAHFIASKQKLSDEFIIKYIDSKLSWESLIYNKNFTYDFIFRLRKKINFNENTLLAYRKFNLRNDLVVMCIKMDTYPLIKYDNKLYTKERLIELFKDIFDSKYIDLIECCFHEASIVASYIKNIKGDIK